MGREKEKEEELSLQERKLGSELLLSAASCRWEGESSSEAPSVEMMRSCCRAK